MRDRLTIFLVVAAAVVAFVSLVVETASAAPARVQAWYMYSTTASALRSEAYRRGCSFAQGHPGGNRVLVLDFGAARKVSAGAWGALSFGSTVFSNEQILGALKAAADGHHNCYGSGDTIVTYGNSNYRMGASGMTQADAHSAGYYQSYRAQQLDAYQRAVGYNRQNAAIASDVEPSWDSAPMSRAIVDGATAHGYALLYDYGSADGCPASGSGGSCNNGWTVGDVGYVSYSGVAVPLPEIYYTVNADQWTVVRRWWNSTHSWTYRFWGTTATTAVGLSPAGGWDALAARNPGLVLSELTCFC